MLNIGYLVYDFGDVVVYWCVVMMMLGGVLVWVGGFCCDMVLVCIGLIVFMIFGMIGDM